MILLATVSKYAALQHKDVNECKYPVPCRCVRKSPSDSGKLRLAAPWAHAVAAGQARGAVLEAHAALVAAEARVAPPVVRDAEAPRRDGALVPRAHP